MRQYQTLFNETVAALGAELGEGMGELRRITDSAGIRVLQDEIGRVVRVYRLGVGRPEKAGTPARLVLTLLEDDGETPLQVYHRTFQISATDAMRDAGRQFLDHGAY